MQEYQQRYLDNLKEIMTLGDLFQNVGTDFDSWYKVQKENRERLALLRNENMSLLQEHLFVTLDTLHDADEDTIRELALFADRLMDWQSNLDCGIYILIHTSLLTLERFRKNRAGVIRELYKLGMGRFYQNRMIEGLEREHTRHVYFENEMLFTEAGSYLKFFPEIEDEETKGYIIRSLANISIASRDLRKSISVSGRILQIVQDPYYRELAPDLPWDVYLRRTHQQMSANRAILSRGGLTAQELSLVLESCEVVFEAEKNSAEPNVRWLWPYYEMEYTCGFADLDTTLTRMENLMRSVPYDQYDVSGLYATVQLPIYYGVLLRDNPNFQGRARRLSVLDRAYRKMMRALMTYPVEKVDDFFAYLLNLVVTDYYEEEGLLTYREITYSLMQRFAGYEYLSARKCGALMTVICKKILDEDPGFFNDIPFAGQIRDETTKRQALLHFAGECGLYHDFGLFKMNMHRLKRSRDFLEDEDRIWRMHTWAGYDDLKKRSSTKDLADVALGHHSWYDASGGFPDDYVRVKSPYRQMTDVAAVCDALLNETHTDAQEAIESVLKQERRRFSPLVTAVLYDADTVQEIKKIIQQDPKEELRGLWEIIREA